jgi:protein-S-isoprenylcysteine O-methyltransferase Ste14
MSFSIAILIVAHGIGVKNVVGFHQIRALDHPVVNIIGFIIGAMGLFLCRTAQNTMGDSWRVGIDQKKKTRLVTDGVYKSIRNPTYSGLFLICIGTFIIFPTMSFMVWGIAFYISIEFQVRAEEEFLEEVHGESYLQYHQATKRYVPFLY